MFIQQIERELEILDQATFQKLMAAFLGLNYAEVHEIGAKTKEIKQDNQILKKTYK